VSLALFVSLIDRANTLGWFHRLLLCLMVFSGVFPAKAGQEFSLPQTEIDEAVEIFKRWTQSYLTQDYYQQWKLTDYRIRRWHDKQQWKHAMRRAQRRSGQLLQWQVKDIEVIDSASVPCTEKHHCFRHGMTLVLITLNTRYSKATPPQPEYAVMVKSMAGWQFAGGTFADRPMGETLLIMDESDEARYSRKKSEKY